MGTPRPAAPAGVLQGTAHRHLGGFFRPDLGFGFASMSTSQNGVDVQISGPAGTFGLAAGSAISEDTILAFHVWDAVVTNPTVSVAGSTINNANATLTLIAFGPELNLYSSDNWYFAVTPSLTRATLATSGNSTNTNWGYGMRAAVGKEWWEGDHWGLGIAAHFSVSVNQDSGTNPATWTGLATTIAFSLTYN